MKSHLAAVAAIYIVTGVLFMALAVLVSMGALVLAPALYGATPWAPDTTGYVVATVLLVSGAFLLIGVPGVIAGIGLLKHKTWARILAIVLAFLALPGFPVGTALGLYALWALTQRETEQVPGTAA